MKRRSSSERDIIWFIDRIIPVGTDGSTDSTASFTARPRLSGSTLVRTAMLRGNQPSNNFEVSYGACAAGMNVDGTGGLSRNDFTSATTPTTSHDTPLT